jgi:hypothetical protein
MSRDSSLNGGLFRTYLQEIADQPPWAGERTIDHGSRTKLLAVKERKAARTNPAASDFLGLCCTKPESIAKGNKKNGLLFGRHPDSTIFVETLSILGRLQKECGKLRDLWGDRTHQAEPVVDQRFNLELLCHCQLQAISS